MGVNSVDENNLVIKGYSDTDWAGNIDSRKSTLGYVSKLAMDQLLSPLKDNQLLQSPLQR